MAKGDKGPKSGTLPNRELYERMNFLFQTSQFLAALAGNANKDTTSQQASDTDAAAVVAAADRQASLIPLARFYSKEMRTIARKSVLRMSPHMRREICRVCATPLLPGVSCIKRVKGKGHGRRVVTTCTYCGNSARLMVGETAENPHVLFVDQPQHATIE
ncbi:Ribonuclease P protein subunit p21 [Coemansia sp. Benny D115]|nr:Ribonuclease P protein subunit p21 [Coemansia sp. Benny D115]